MHPKPIYQDWWLPQIKGAILCSVQHVDFYVPKYLCRGPLHHITLCWLNFSISSVIVSLHFNIYALVPTNTPILPPPRLHHFMIWSLSTFRHEDISSNGCVPPSTSKHVKKSCSHNGDFPKWSVTFTEFSEFRENNNYWSINWVQFKDLVSHMCWAGAVVACWPLTQEVAGWQGFESFYWMTYSVNSVKTFRKNSNMYQSFTAKMLPICIM